MSASAPVRRRADMHVHTCHSGWRHLRLIHPRDSYSRPLDVYRKALERGMDFVAISDHDTLEGALRLLEEPGVDPSRVIVGEEIECTFAGTGQWVHLNVYGLGESDHRRLHALKGDVRDAAAYCRERGLLHVLNHPFQSYLFQVPPARYAEEILSLFSHVEGLNGGVPALQNRAVGALCRAAGASGRHLVQVGGSDAHTVGRVGTAWTEATAEDPRAFLDEVKAGRCSVGGGSLRSAGLVAEVYKVVATYYGRLYAGRGDAPDAGGYAVDLLCATACLPFAAGGLPALITLASQARQKIVSAATMRALAGVTLQAIPAPAGGSAPCPSEA